MKISRSLVIRFAALVLLFIFSSAVVAGEPAPGVCTKDNAERRIEDVRVITNAYMALAEEHIAGMQRSLTVLASTDEARSGDWNAIKSLLSGFNAMSQAAVWYARTDGRYYTTEKGLTDMNISDRPYFARLMQGYDVAGDLVISRSTGKRAAVVAVPISKDKKVIGALGVSMSADEFSRMLQERMSLPKDMIFYALDTNGQTSLHKESSLLFVFPSDMGSKSLREAIKEMLSKPEGVARYEYNGEKIVVYKKSRLTDWVFAIGIITGPSSGSEVPPILFELGKEITLNLNNIDSALSRAAGGLSATDLSGAEARRIILDLCRAAPNAADCSTVSRTGKMLAVEPQVYRQFEGSDISRQEQIVRLHNTKKPVMSQVIRTVEGFDAVDIQHPVFSPKGDFVGSVSVLIRPESLIADVAAPLVQGLPIDIWMMQTDGRIIYDPDEEEIGRMLFDDPIYKSFPELLSLGARIAKERSGAGSYNYYATGMKEKVRKDAYWTTTGQYGTEWRLVVTHTLTDDSAHAKRDLAELGVKSSEDALRAVAGQEELKIALEGDDREKIKGIFKKFLAENYGIYAIQWVDSAGISRYGYPEENSPMNFDFHSLKTPSSKPILKAIEGKKESSFEAPLVEGKGGRFFMIPVYKGDSFLGMVYMIRLKP